MVSTLVLVLVTGRRASGQSAASAIVQLESKREARTLDANHTRRSRKWSQAPGNIEDLGMFCPDNSSPPSML